MHLTHIRHMTQQQPDGNLQYVTSVKEPKRNYPNSKLLELFILYLISYLNRYNLSFQKHIHARKSQ